MDINTGYGINQIIGAVRAATMSCSLVCPQHNPWHMIGIQC